jgi:prophage antirepressor-like protein
MNLPQIFNFGNQQIRTVEEDGEHWFVAADVCNVLNLGNVSMSTARLDDDECTLISIDGASNGLPMNAVNESGLYSLILGCRKPEAKRFKKWVTSEVLPAIRKTGSYGVSPLTALEDPAAMRTLLLGYAEKVIQRDKLISHLQPQADALHQLENSDGMHNLTVAAKVLSVPPQKFIADLSRRDWIYRMGDTGAWTGKQPKIDMGYLVHKIYRQELPDGTDKSRAQVLITPKGMARLAVLYSTQP